MNNKENYILTSNRFLHYRTNHLIVIGASTGGIEALSKILPLFPADCSGIVIVQHMSTGMAASSVAKHLNDLCEMQVKEAQDNDHIKRGHILLAPSGILHTTIIRSEKRYRIKLVEGEPVNHSRPSVDVLFNSVAKSAGKNVAAALLTGMGKDGALGLKAIKDAGGKTIAQNQETCVIFGMPQMAILLDAADKIAPLEKIPDLLINAFN